MAKWEVELFISSDTKIEKKFSFQTEKGDYEPFYSKINIENYYNTLLINIQALAETEKDSIDAAFYFIGQALNYISWKTKSYFKLATHVEQVQLRKRKTSKQIISKEVWEEAFQIGRRIQIDEPELAMALGWYRKSLNSEDPIDAFLSKWLVLESICKKVKLSTILKNEKTKDDSKEYPNRKFKGEIFYKIKQYIKSNNITTLLTCDRLYDIKNTRNKIAHGELHINNVDIIKIIIKMDDEISTLVHDVLKKDLITKGYISDI